MSESSLFTPTQMDLLIANSVEAVQNGLASRYNSHLRYVARAHAAAAAAALSVIEFGETPAIPLKDIEMSIEANLLAQPAEVPFCFVRNQNPQVFSFGLAKLNVNNGRLISDSCITFGLKFEDRDNHERLGPGFTEDDAAFVLRSLVKQTELGMNFDFFDGLIRNTQP